MFLADFHVHTRFSDGKHDLKTIVDAYGTRGFGAIAVTDHLCETATPIGVAARILRRTLTRDNFSVYWDQIQAEKARAWDQYKMVLIPGVELTKNYVSNDRSAHVLGLGITDFVSADGELIDLAKNLKNQGALTIAAHPVHTRMPGEKKQTYALWHGRHELAPHFDAWEVASGPHLFPEVQHSGLPMIASSDLHRLTQMSSWKTRLSCERHPEAILAAIKRQEIDFEFYADPVVQLTESAISLGCRN